jgi:hypothetical protein
MTEAFLSYVEAVPRTRYYRRTNTTYSIRFVEVQNWQGTFEERFRRGDFTKDIQITRHRTSHSYSFFFYQEIFQYQYFS